MEWSLELVLLSKAYYEHKLVLALQEKERGGESLEHNTTKVELGPDARFCRKGLLVPGLTDINARMFDCRS